jgi:cell division protein FtsW (lipid II flippase)
VTLARVELLGLLAASLVTSAAVVLAAGAKAVRAGDIDAGIASGRILALNEKPAADALTKVLMPAASPGEAPARAAAIGAWLARQDAPNVGALAPILSRAQLSALKPSFVVRRLSDFRNAVALSLLVVLGAFYFLHAMRRHMRSAADPLLLPCVHLLCGIGLALMVGLRDPVRDLLIAPPFASGVALGCFLAALVWRAPVERFALQYAPLAGAFALSLLLIAFGRGPAGSDARVNLWGFQPVEIIRLLVVLYLAAFFARRWQHLRNIRDARAVDLLRTRVGLRRLSVPPVEYVVPVVAALALVCLFFLVQRDLGPALVFGCVFLALWAVAVRRAGLAVVGLAGLAAGFWAVVQIGFPATLATRVAMAADPWTNAFPGGDQVAHALWAMASGGIAGAGPGLGDPQYIPAGHTDLVLAVLGEELGFVGWAAIALTYAVLCQRAVGIALRASSDFTFFLALGLTVALFTQLALIAGGGLGLLPLSGVVTPFLSYGRSAMVANFIAIGALLAISHAGTAQPREAAVRHFARPVAVIAGCIALFGILAVGRAFHAQVFAADATMASSALVKLADGGVRFEANPRLLAAARQYLRRGDIVDRNGLVLATSDPAVVAKQAAALARLGIDAASVCRPGRARCYPFGGRLFHLLGDLNTELDWRATNTSFVERDEAVHLQGFDDHRRVVTLRVAGSPVRVVHETYEELVPLARYKYGPAYSPVRDLRERPRDLRLTIDARLQVRVADLLRRGIEESGGARGAAAVIDARTGEILAAASYPWLADDASQTPETDARLDRVRYGLYPPGSTFKLVTAAAALTLKPEAAASRHMCVRLPDGRVGARIAGAPRPVRDDTLDTHPHGRIGLDEALRVSCNAYFAQLARDIGPEPLLAMASRFEIDAARPNNTARLGEQLPYAGFGQGETLTTPLRLLGVTAAIAAGGLRSPAHLVLDPPAPAEPERVFPASAAARLARDMSAAVASGTGRAVAGVRPAIAGKTGTAEVGGAPSHSWFTGFAPASGGGRRLAFVVLVEHGGYGGRTAAPIAGRIVQAARDLQLFQGDGE